MKSLSYVLLLIPILLLSGCVSMGKYKTLDQQKIDLEIQKGMLSERVDSLVTEVRLLSKALDEQKALLVKEIGQKNADLNQQQAEYDRLEQELKMKTALLNAKNDSLMAQTTIYDQRLNQLQAKQAEYENMVRDKEQESKNYQALLNSLKSELNDKSVTIQNLEGKLTVTFVNEVLFESGSASISSKGKAILDDFARGMKDNPGYRINVIGHTDNVGISGLLAKTYPSNWELSTARAVAVVRYLSEKSGMTPENLHPEGQSYYAPVASNDTAEGRAKNRRVEIVIVPIAKTAQK